VSDRIAVPREALKAMVAAKLAHRGFVRDRLTEDTIRFIEREAEAEAFAMLRAWPGMWQKGDAGTFGGAVPYPAIILPLPQEKADDQA
jgi:hypothetical protein